MKDTRAIIIGLVAIVGTAIFFLVPFAFVFLTASKPVVEANLLEFSWPEQFVLFDNLRQALQARDYLLVIAYINSFILTVASVAGLVIFASMVAYVWQRRPSRLSPVISILVLAGLIVPPAVVPTIWVLQTIGLFKTMPGLILIEIAFGLPFCILLFRAFISTVPRAYPMQPFVDALKPLEGRSLLKLDEAAIVDGAGPVQVFFRVIFPVLRSVVMTVIILQSVFVYNDFQNPLYFLPGTQNATVQLTLFNFRSQFTSQFNLLFANILLVMIPALIMFIIFNRKIVAGLTSGAVKG